MPARTKPTGFGVICPFCGDTDATMTIELNDLAACHCTGCDQEFSPAEAIAKLTANLAAWQRVARLAEAADDLFEFAPAAASRDLGTNNGTHAEAIPARS